MTGNSPGWSDDPAIRAYLAIEEVAINRMCLFAERLRATEPARAAELHRIAKLRSKRLLEFREGFDFR